MSLDYFDDEFMEGIPSIAPDLMFVEETNPTTLPVLQSEDKEEDKKECKQIEEEVLTEVIDDPELESSIEVDNLDVSKDIDSPLPPESVKEETPEESLIVLTNEDKETLLNFIIDDHSYARPYPEISVKKEENTVVYSPVSSILKLHPRDLPPKKKYKKRGQKNKLMSEDDVDVVSVDKPDELLVKYDASRGRHVMNEVESYLNSLWKDIEKDDEEKISRGSWSKEQARLFDTVHGAINNYQLAKLTHSQNSNEPILRKLALEKATSRVRKAFGSVSWNSKLVVWLHGVMIDGLCSSFFLCYLEVLQSLKRKVPSLFERIFLNDKFAREKEQTAGLSNLGATLRKSWEPAVGLHTKLTMEKFPISPFLITIPCGPSVPHQSTKRNRFWNYQLMNIGKAVPISVPAYRTPEGYVVKHYLEHCISAVRSKTSEFTTRFPDRPIVLIGWNVGALLAMKVALLDKVDAVICLGFPCNHVEGDECQEYWEAFAKIGCPVLFVIGTHALTSSIEKIDNLRQKMKVHTNLIIMESADELLRLTKSHKRSLSMTQNMIDRLIQDQLYLFLRDVLFKPKHFAQQVKDLQTPKKKKKKLNSNSTENTKDENKKRKKSKQFQLLTTSGELSSPFALSPLDVSVGGIQADKVDGQMEGLLTTGSISTPIPVTQMQNESLLVPTSMSNLTVIGTDHSHNLQKTGQKRPLANKEKAPRKKVSKKVQKSPQNFTASLGNQRAGNLFGQRFSSAISNRSSNVQQQTATLQRLPSGTFVLSGTSGPVKLQNGNNIVYLQQLTSSGGTTQVIQTPLIANPNGTFSTVPLTSNQQQKTSSSLISTSTLFLTSSVPTSAVVTTIASSKLTSTSTTETTNQVLTSALQVFPPRPTDSTAQQHQQLSVPSSPQEREQTDVTVEAESATTSDLSTDTGANLPVSLANFILSLPSSTTGGQSLEASAKAQSLLQKLSEDDLKTLAAVLGKYSSASPKSSASPSPVMTPELGSPLQSPSSICQSPSDGQQTPLSPNLKEQNSKSKLLAMFENQKTFSSASATSTSHALHNLKKISHPLSLTQKVTTIQHDMNKMRGARLKPPRITTGTSLSKSNTATVSTTNKFLSSKTQKVPITITIPISRLPSNFQLTTSSSSSSKTINVPALSAYLAQQKFVLSTGKSTNLDSRTVLLSPSNVKKMGSSIMVSTNSNKNPSVFTPNKTPQKVSSSSKPSATITLHLPAQSTQKETLKKAASDVKLIGVLNQKTKPSQVVNLPSLKPSGLPGSSVSMNPSPGELSPIQPRTIDESTSALASLSEGNLSGSPANDLLDESDIDFFVQPGSTLPTPPQFPSTTTASQMPTFNPSQKQIVTASKIIRVPVSTGDRRLPFNAKNIAEIPKNKFSENQLMNSARKVGVAFQQRNVEAKSYDSKDSSSTDTTSLLDGNKLKFEPLNTSSTRPNLSSVLSSMRETGKIVLDEHGQLRNTIVAKPTVVSSKTAAMIARTAFMTDTKLAAKSLSFSSLNSSNKSNSSQKSITPALFSGGKPLSNTSMITTPAATIRTATTSKILPVTIKSNDFIRMSTQVRVQQQQLLQTPKQMVPKIMKKDPPRSEIKSKATKKTTVIEKSEPKKEPPPYVTRSGRVLRTRFSFSDEMERKSPRKRRRTNSTSKEESCQQISQQQSPVTSTTPLSNIGSSLDSLVEAAKLITTSNENKCDTLNTADVTTTSIEDISAVSLPTIDSTTNIAATAMLELLSSDTSGISKSLNEHSTPETNQTISSQIITNFEQVDTDKGLTFVCDSATISKEQQNVTPLSLENTPVQPNDEDIKTDQARKSEDYKSSLFDEVIASQLSTVADGIVAAGQPQAIKHSSGSNIEFQESLDSTKSEQLSQSSKSETLQGGEE